MGWLDALPDSATHPITGKKCVGLQLLLEIEDEKNVLPTHLKPHLWNNTVGKQSEWKRIEAVRLTLHPHGVRFLEDWFSNQTLRQSRRYNDPLVSQNLRYMRRHAKEGEKGMLYPEVDLIDLTYVQYGLDGCLWEEFPNGIPGIIVDRSCPHMARKGWIPVVITKNFQAPNELKPFLPCLGVLTWD